MFGNYLKKYALYLAFLIAWTATSGSLFFSEILKYPPCLLCWYQRILMFPLVLILTVAIIRKDKNVPYYVLPMSILGALIALYQYLLQMTTLSQSSLKISCSLYEPCEKIQFLFAGFITIPFLSFIAFVIITILMILMLVKTTKK